MKRIIMILMATVLLCGLCATIEAKKRTSSSGRASNTSNKTLVIKHKHNGPGEWNYVYYLYPSGKVKLEMYKYNYLSPLSIGEPGTFSLISTEYGSWTEYSTRIGNNNLQYYYEIRVNGSEYYWTKGSYKLYWNWSSWNSSSSYDFYKIEWKYEN